MGEKDTKIQLVYIKTPDGNKYEMGGFPEVNGEMLIHGDSDERLENSLGSLTFEIDIKKLYTFLIAGIKIRYLLKE